MYAVSVRKGYLLYDRFTCATAGAVPSGWTASAAGGIASAQAWRVTHPKDTLSFKLANTTSSPATLQHYLPAAFTKTVFEYKFILPIQVDGVFARLQGGGYDAVAITTSGQNICYVDSSGALIPIWTNYMANVWYTIRIVADPVSHTADIYVNGKLQASAAAFATPGVGAFGTVRFESPSTVTGTMWVDDIYVYPFQANPADYVPAPQPAASATNILGMQSFFSGWRNGHQNGWEWIYRYPNHDPLIGFCDEGNREAMDWQLKYMAEAGINFFMDDWDANANAMQDVGYPMKEPAQEYTDGALHSGYFYAKYANNVKFAIADYSIQFLTAAKFENYIVPYWIEYYFRDPRYMTIDNKPVIGLGVLSQWATTLGSWAAVGTELNYLRQQLVNRGFAGAIFLGKISSTATATDLDNLDSAGVDYAYAYTWGTGNYVTMENKMIALRDSGSQLGIIPVVSQGWSGEAWDIPTSGYVAPADFGTLCNWVQSTFQPTLPVGSLGKNLVLFGNWNEFGEGHYIAPTNLYGFGYVDQIRSVFTGASIVDQAPTAAQKARINILYTRSWDGRVWGFDSIYSDAEGWTVNYQVTNFAQSHGYLNGTISGGDPSIISRDGFSIDASQYSLIIIRMKNSSAGTVGRVYFITDQDGVFTQAKSLSFPIIPNDPSYTEYAVNMYGVPGWNGTHIRQLRIDPVDDGTSTGTFSIDWIKLVSAP